MQRQAAPVLEELVRLAEAAEVDDPARFARSPEEDDQTYVRRVWRASAVVASPEQVDKPQTQRPTTAQGSTPPSPDRT